MLSPDTSRSADKSIKQATESVMFPLSGTAMPQGCGVLKSVKMLPRYGVLSYWKSLDAPHVLHFDSQNMIMKNSIDL